MKCLLPLDKQCENIVVSYFHSIADFIFFIISHLFLSRLCSLTSKCITCYSFCVHTFNNWDSRLIKSVYDVTFAQYQSTRMKSARQTWIIKSNCMKEKSVRASEQKIWRKITANDKIYISSSIHRHSVIHHGFAPNKIWKWIWICTFPPVAIATTPRAATPSLLGHVYLTRTEGFFSLVLNYFAGFSLFTLATIFSCSPILCQNSYRIILLRKNERKFPNPFSFWFIQALYATRIRMKIA